MASPKLVERRAQPFASIHVDIAPDQLASVIDKSFGTLFGWLAQRGIQPAGAPFVKYNVVDMAKRLDLELGVPVTAPVQAAGEVLAGTLPAGRYAVVIHRGHYNGLREATAELLQSAQALSVTWDAASAPSGERFAARLETYLTDPSKEPDPTQWQTEIAIKTR
jgi:effector-binding domain-containing protein